MKKAFERGFEVVDIMRLLGCGSLVVLGLAGCASHEPTPEEQAAEAAAAETIDQILNAPLTAADYAKPERCLSTFEYKEMEVLDNQHVLFKGTGDRLWINKLRNPCVGLQRTSTPVIRLRDAQICDLDTFQAMESMLGWTRTSANCSLGEFTPVTREQADSIENALKEVREQRSR